MKDQHYDSHHDIAIEHDYLLLPDQTRLFYRIAKQNTAAPLLFFVHGYSDHSGSFTRIMTWFYQQGYHVGSFDVRGHGKSSGDRGYIDHYDTYSHDFHAILSHIKECCNPTQINLIAHSNGGLITTYYQLTHPTPIYMHHIVLCAPYLGLHTHSTPSSISRLFWKTIGAIYPRATVPKKLNAERLTHDKAMQQYYAQDPLRFHLTSIQWFLAAQNAQLIVHNRASLWKDSHLFLLMTDADTVVDNKKSAHFFSQIHTKKHHKTLNNAYHHLLNEINYLDIYNLIYHWIDTQSDTDCVIDKSAN